MDSGDSSNYTQIGAVIGGVVAGVAGVLGLRRGVSKHAPLTSPPHVAAAPYAICTEHSERLARQETLTQTILTRLEDLRDESRERDKVIFKKLDKFSADLNVVKGQIQK